MREVFEIFPKKKVIKITKINKENAVWHIVDYSSHKDREMFCVSLLEDFAQNHSILIVADTEWSYEANNINKGKKLLEIKEELEERGISCKEIITQKEADVTILGVRVRNQKKVNCCQLGLAMNPGQLKETMKLLGEYCVCVYLLDRETSHAALLELFEKSCGNHDTISTQSQIQLYVDNYLKRIKITENNIEDGIVEAKLIIYNE